jgi:ATP-dependent DNA helicase RecG
LIANAFFRAGYIESWGRGIQKIQRECREHGIEPPVYDFEMAGLLLTFRANPAHVQAALEQGETAQETAQENQRTAQEAAQTTPNTAQETNRAAQETAQETRERVLALLRSHPPITRRELASKLGLSDSGIKYHLEKMKAAGVIRHVGATKSGYWEVMK